jgi:hypothetical protein
MGTRGYVVIKINGNYYSFYNHFDSYPSGLGFAVLVQIVRVIKMHNGRIREALEYWRKLFTKVLEKELSEDVMFRRMNVFELEAEWKNTTAVYEMEESTKPIKSDGTWIEYIWEIDLDDAKFGMCTISRAEYYYWSWLQIKTMGAEATAENAEYLHLITYTPKLEWYDNIECMLFLIYQFNYKSLLVTALQALVRGFLTRRQQFGPPNGFFYRKPKKHFELQVEGWKI